MNAGGLLTKYERIADAPEAIARLRRFILDLAVRGKLVPQDPKDEPASELLKRIAKEKVVTASSQSSRGRRAEGRERTADFDFELPTGWELSTLGVVALKITDGAHQTPTYVTKGVPFISVKDFSAGKLDLSSTRFIAEEEHRVLYKRCDPKRGDILIGRIGTLGRAVLVDTDDEFSLFVSVGLIRFSHANIVADFFRMLLNSPLVEAEFDRIKIGGGTHTNKLNLSDLQTVVLPLPPLAEQHRIVAKVDELMALCDRLEATRAEREATRDRLTAASLARLNAPDPDTFQEDARFALDALPALTTRPDQIKQLRQTILNLAVSGKLVPQDPKDEPASELLKQIARERAKRAAKANVRAKRTVRLSDDVDGLSPVDRWGSEALANLVDPTASISYGVLVPGPDVEGGVAFVRAQDLFLSGHPDRPSKTIAPEIEAAYARTRLRGGEILLCVVGSIGKLGTVPESWAGANIARAVARIAPVKSISSTYLLMALRTSLIQSYFTDATRTLAQPTLNIGLIEKLPIPLPPLAEQHRIVAKVDELMALCDRLEKSLTTGEESRRRLLDALLAEALEPIEGDLEQAA